MEAIEPGFGLRVMAALRAAAHFGLDSRRAVEVARRIDPRAHGFERFVDALWVAVLTDVPERPAPEL